MVVRFADLEIDLQWKWLFRPRQRDGMTVDDYYVQFCSWKEEMISVSFPAKEEDYVDGFVENLKWDVRWRSSKYESSRIGLKMAFHNAKFEESMMQLEAYSQTPVVENQTAESDSIVVEEICVDDAGSVAHEKGYELASCNHSDLRSETTDEHHLDEEFEVNELQDLDFNGIQGNDSTNSEVVPDLEEYKVSESALNSHSSADLSHQKQLMPMDSGFKVLSIYCAHMAPKWNNILEMRPKQSNDMSVEVYYDQFFNWKRKLEEVNYIGGEESYVDDFIYGLEIKLGMRVCGYKWKPNTLYGAFRRAVIEESLMQDDADMVLDEMPQLNSSDIQGVENVSDGHGNVVLHASGLVSDRFRSYSPIESIFQGDESQVDVLKDSACNVIEEMVKPNSTYFQLAWKYHEPVVTENVEQTMSDGVGKPSVMNMECLKVAGNLFDGSLTQFSVKQNIWSDGLGKWEPYMFDFKDAPMKMMFGGAAMLMFDPGICSWHLKDCDSINSREIPRNSVVDLWLRKVMFCFDPGGSRPHRGCVLLGEHGDFHFTTNVVDAPEYIYYAFDEDSTSHSSVGVYTLGLTLGIPSTGFVRAAFHEFWEQKQASIMLMNAQQVLLHDMDKCNVVVTAMFHLFPFSHPRDVIIRNVRYSRLEVTTVDMISALLPLLWYIELAFEGMEGVTNVFYMCSVLPIIAIMDKSFFNGTESKVSVKYIAGIYNIFYYGVARKEIEEYGRRLLRMYSQEVSVVLQITSMLIGMRTKDHLTTFIWCMFASVITCGKGATAYVQENVYGGATRRNKYELVILARTEEFSVSINVMINEIAGLSNHNIRFLMLVSLGHNISILFLDVVLWVHMIDFPSMSKLEFNLQVYDPFNHGDIIGLKACTGCVCVCIADCGVAKAFKPQRQKLIEHVSWVEEALNKVDVDLPSDIKVLLEMLIDGTKIVGMVTWHRKLHGHKLIILAGSIILNNFVWDPGQDVISLYIIEDNDVLKRKGIRIQLALALKQDDISNEACAHYYAHTGLLACSLVDWRILLLLNTSSKFRIRKSNKLKEILVTCRSVGLNCEVIVDAMRFKMFDADSELNIVVQNLINKDIKPSQQFGLAFSALGLEHYIWDPGSYATLIGSLVLMHSATYALGRESLVANGNYYDTTSILMKVTTSTVLFWSCLAVGCGVHVTVP